MVVADEDIEQNHEGCPELACLERTSRAARPAEQCDRGVMHEGGSLEFDVNMADGGRVLRSLDMFSLGRFPQAGSTSGFGGGAVIFCYVKTRAGEAAEAESTVTGEEPAEQQRSGRQTVDWT